MDACSTFTEMPGHPRTCWACGAPKRDHEARTIRELDAGALDDGAGRGPDPAGAA